MRTEKQLDTPSLTEYTEAIRRNPDSAEVYFQRGLARASRNQDPRAIADYDEALRMNPDFTAAYFHRGCLKDYLAPRESRDAARRELLRSAIEDFDAAIRLDLEPSLLSHAYYRRGTAKYNLDRYEAAIADLDEALSLDPENPEIRSARKDAADILNFYKRGIADFDERIQKTPDDISIYKIRGETKGFLGHTQAAKADFQEILARTTDRHIIAEIERHFHELDNPDYWQQYSWRT